MVSAFSELLSQLRRRFTRRDLRRTPSPEDRKFVVASCQAWFRDYSQPLQQLGVPAEYVAKLNQFFGQLLRLSGTSSRGAAYSDVIHEVDAICEQMLPAAQIAEWQAGAAHSSTADEIAVLLQGFDPDLATRYSQVIADLSDSTRASYTGTAGELREIFRLVLHKLAPDEQVMGTEWFKLSRASAPNEDDKKRRPTQAERVRYILETKRAARDEEIATARANDDLVDAILGRVARSSYENMNSQLHGQKDRTDVVRCIQYLKPLLIDLLS